MAATGSGSAYNHLLAAAGDTALTNYFPNYRPDGEVKANAYILNKVQRKAGMRKLETMIAARAAVTDGTSWTAKLVAKGMDKAAQKLGEEAVETVIAAVRGDDESLIAESADLLYHWLVVLRIAGIPLEAVMAALERRTGQSGLQEKAGRAD